MPPHQIPLKKWIYVWARNGPLWSVETLMQTSVDEGIAVLTGQSSIM